MSDSPVYEIIARAFAAEGVDTQFTVMGDANMYWADALTRRHGVRTIHVRHEHSAVMAAIGYTRLTGKPGIASTTCGPGFTQVLTALTLGARAELPIVVFAGDTPLNAGYSIQALDIAPFARAAGAHYIPIHHADRALDCTREAFYLAQAERRPVVLAVPMDIQQQPFPYFSDYSPSVAMLPRRQRPQPDPALVEEAVDMIVAARRPIILAGRGVMQAGAEAEVEALAEQSGALIGTTLLAKDLFYGKPFAVGVSGAFAGNLARELFAESDLVVAIGAALSYQTTEAGYMYPNAKVVQVDTNPRGMWHSLRTADLHLRADAKAGATAILARLRERRVNTPGYRSAELQQRIATEVFDPKPYTPAPGTMDPRTVLTELDRVIPKDWTIVTGLGHAFTFVMTTMGGRRPDRWMPISDFGTIGSALPAAIGVAASRTDGKVLLIDGDGGLIMHIQELETIRRHGLRLLICCMNDGAYGAELHRFRAHGMDTSSVVHGRGTQAAVASAFGLASATVTEPGRLEALFRDYLADNRSAFWDLHIDGDLPSPQYRRVHYGEA